MEELGTEEHKENQETGIISIICMMGKYQDKQLSSFNK